MNQLIQGERDAFQLRGTVPADHSLATCCYDKPPRAAFKLVLALTDEAIHARDGLKRLLTDDHPLSQNLRDMAPHEALAYLLGLTKAGPGTLSLTRSNPAITTLQESDKPIVTPPHRAPQPESTGTATQGVNLLPDLDDEDLLAFSPSAAVMG